MMKNTESLMRMWLSMLTLSCALVVLTVSAVPATAAIVRQPYLQLVTQTSVTIMWRTDLNSADNSRVQYGLQAGNLDQTATGTAAISPSNANVKDHLVTITGLNVATTYFYNVGTATDDVQGGGTNQHFFVTAPPIGSPAPVRAWVLGDSGDALVDQRLVRDAMLSETVLNPPNIILHMGDIAYNDGTDAEFTTNHFAVYQDILRHTPLWPTLGNHESPSVNTSLGLGPYYEGHVLPANAEAGGVASGTEAYYAFDYANVHFIVLDSMDSRDSNNDPSPTMLSWLQNDLGSTAQDWVIAFWHHPPYTKGSHDSDIAADSGGRMIDMREIVLPILEAGGVDLVLAGHSHNYERSYLLDGAYGYGDVTPSFETLLTNGNILDAGDGDPSGNGAYQKNAGGTSNNGAVYVVAGHGGHNLASAVGNHPVMAVIDRAYGSVLLDISGSTLTMRNLRSGGAITDTVAIEKSPEGTNLAPNGVIDTPSGDQTISVGQTLTFTGTGTDQEPNLPLTHHWTFGTDSGIPDANVEDPGTVTFNSAGVFTVTYTVTDALGLSDPTPANMQVTVNTLTISNLTVASGKTYVVPAVGIQAGELVYIDRAFTFTTVPASIQGAAYIQTANDDKAATTEPFLSFDVNEPVTVYVAHDTRITTKPAWLSTFSDTGQDLVTSDTTLRLFAQAFSAGTITLGGNASGGGFSMYSVIVQPQEGSDPPPDTTPPTVALTAPDDGATVSGTITVSATATDDVGVAGVQFRLNGNTLGAEDTTEPFSLSWDTTMVLNDTYTLTATARDAAGNSTTSAPHTVTVSNTTSDPSSLTISNLTVASGQPYVVPPSGLQVGDLVYIDRSFTFTSVPAGVQGAAYIQTANNDKAATNAVFLTFDVNQPVIVQVAHDVRITTKPSWLSTFTDTGQDLVTSDTTLHLFAQAFPAGTITLGGNTSGGGFSMYSVIIQSQEGGTSDTTPPSVSLTSPEDEATVSGTITVSATATDDVGVAGVQFRLNGNTLGAEDTTEPFSLSWDTTMVLNDTYTLTATARDAAGNSTTSAPHTVTVSNTTSDPSSLTISNLTVASGQPYVVPAVGIQAGETVYIDRAFTFTTVPASIQGAAYIQTANDDKAATTTNFLSFDVNEPVTVYVAHDTRITTKPAWLSTFSDTGQDLVTSDTTLRLFAQAFSAGTITLGGNASGGGFSMYSVIIQSQEGGTSDTTPPSVSLTSPEDEATVSGTITVSATATDDVGVAGVQFRLNGNNLGAEDTTDPFSLSWDTTTVPNDSYTLTATARDAAGNTTTSSPITVTVSNSTSSTLTISNLTVASGQPYVVPPSGLQVGDLVYIDRSFTFTAVPAGVQGAAYIQTANDDKAATDAVFLTFEVNEPVTVSVAHDTRITTKPSWLSTFTDTGQDLVTSDTTLHLFAQAFPTGTITLGGNTSGGGFSMYSVVVQPQ